MEYKDIQVDQHKKVGPGALRIYGCNGEWIQATSLPRAMSILFFETGDDDFEEGDWEERPLDGDERFFLEDVTPEEVVADSSRYVPEGGEIIIKGRRVFVQAPRRKWLEHNPYEQYYFSENI